MNVSKVRILLLFSFAGGLLAAQELDCRVVVRHERLQQTDKRIFKTLESTLNGFVNQMRWTDRTYKDHERIKCSFIINLSNREGDNFLGSIEVQSVRPVFNSTYSTSLLYFNDKDFAFTYKEFDIVEFSENTFISNLSSVLAYYAYIVVGMDMDSFAELGGQEYLEKALDVANSAQNSNYKGWDSTQSRNRHALINELLNNIELRKGMYSYHIKYLDHMTSSVGASKKGIAKILPVLKRYNHTFVGQIVNTTKKDELLSIFEKEKQKEGEIRDLLRGIYSDL